MKDMEKKYALINEYIEDRIHRTEIGICEFATKEAHDKAFLEELEHLHNGVTQQKWIPVTERLPSEKGTYLIFTDRGGILMAHWYGKSWGGGYAVQHITHWMPLPLPPKEGE